MAKRVTDRWVRFKDQEERIGAMRCCVSSCKKPSAWVYYFSGMMARQSICEAHGVERGARDRCEAHPKYQGKRPPRTDCTMCWERFMQCWNLCEIVTVLSDQYDLDWWETISLAHLLQTQRVTVTYTPEGDR